MSEPWEQIRRGSSIIRLPSTSLRSWVPSRRRRITRASGCTDVLKGLDIKSIAISLRKVYWESRETFRRHVNEKVVDVMEDLQMSWKREMEELWRKKIVPNPVEEAWKRLGRGSVRFSGLHQRSTMRPNPKGSTRKRCLSMRSWDPHMAAPLRHRHQLSPEIFPKTIWSYQYSAGNLLDYVRVEKEAPETFGALERLLGMTFNEMALS